VKCTIEMDSGGMIYIPTFMKIGTGVQAILGFCLGGAIYVTSSRTIGSGI
jgi:hypothetical protein